MKPRFVLPIVLALAFPGVLLAQLATDPAVGSWVLNVAKSSFKPGPALQSETRTYEAKPDGIHVTIRQVAADGTASTQTTIDKLNGKPYAFTGNSSIDAVEVRRVNSREVRTTEMHNGKVVGHLTRIVSKDGKTLTLSFTGLIQDVRVYDRQ